MSTRHDDQADMAVHPSDQGWMNTQPALVIGSSTSLVVALAFIAWAVLSGAVDELRPQVLGLFGGAVSLAPTVAARIIKRYVYSPSTVRRLLEAAQEMQREYGGEPPMDYQHDPDEVHELLRETTEAAEGDGDLVPYDEGEIVPYEEA